MGDVAVQRDDVGVGAVRAQRDDGPLVGIQLLDGELTAVVVDEVGGDGGVLAGGGPAEAVSGEVDRCGEHQHGGGRVPDVFVDADRWLLGEGGGEGAGVDAVQPGRFAQGCVGQGGGGVEVPGAFQDERDAVPRSREDAEAVAVQPQACRAVRGGEAGQVGIRRALAQQHGGRDGFRVGAGGGHVRPGRRPAQDAGQDPGGDHAGEGAPEVRDGDAGVDSLSSYDMLDALTLSI
ncbi:hypothetical protein [Streptomyces sp. MI02-7b]|uniref:hypothetical protein n=1 Tax=Streptomyces sp. MI02-7b TaxID=462941 RepID=UPI0029B79B9F|nr:hypothetical protein [Streptomyces sp. MI02-7b]MDX3075917.1 hypothetical protein [Streptomyces sp. MI02-7b]